MFTKMKAAVAAVAILMPITAASASTLAAHADATATGVNRAPQSEGCFWNVAPDGTAGISGFTGQGRDGMGWIGNADGEGGPSNVSRSSEPHQFAQAECPCSGHTDYGRRVA